MVCPVGGAERPREVGLPTGAGRWPGRSRAGCSWSSRTSPAWSPGWSSSG